MKRTSLFMAASALGLVLALSFANAQDAPKKDKKDKDKEEAAKTIEDFVDGFDRMDGLFPIYQDEETGALYMAVSYTHLTLPTIYSV